jgi:hypothetical protein
MSEDNASLPYKPQNRPLVSQDTQVYKTRNARNFAKPEKFQGSLGTPLQTDIQIEMKYRRNE